jgi:hypothetical protein
MTAENPNSHERKYSNPHGRESLQRVSSYLRNGHVGKARRTLEKKAWEVYSAALGSVDVNLSLRAAAEIIQAVAKYGDGLKREKDRKRSARERKSALAKMVEDWNREKAALDAEALLRQAGKMQDNTALAPE